MIPINIAEELSQLSFFYESTILICRYLLISLYMTIYAYLLIKLRKKYKVQRDETIYRICNKHYNITDNILRRNEKRSCFRPNVTFFYDLMKLVLNC